jgi:hypothetical protein
LQEGGSSQSGVLQVSIPAQARADTQTSEGTHWRSQPQVSAGPSNLLYLA